MAGTRPALPDATNAGFLAEALAEVNAYRAKHHAPPLAMDPLLVEYARSRAASRSEHEQLEAGHDGLRAGTGESLFWGAGPEMSGAGEAVAGWYAEIAAYDWAAPPGDGASGHFAQLVWKGSTRMGAGRVAGQGSEHFETYIVLVFEPPGNVGGAYAENVQPA
ncbi:CAP domain-containing protein [Nonomuraea zeae]|uniref:Serine protease n=1 Tax=Nonomuraea zeae TaxID=1642303 RepID=A0A5S4HI74_9ACTN|nr:CAP domain-containing protein [Nonomuraea zeae]TMR38700.1 serine protease [Nonomuraea zeae]